jgi:hypothetical protein
MHRLKTGGPRAAIVAAILALSAVVLVACGSSSSGSSTTASVAAAGTTATGTATAPPTASVPGTGTTPTTPGAAHPGTPAYRGRFAKLRECLQKNGVTFPPQTSKGSFKFKRPQGVSQAQFQAAIQKCGDLLLRTPGGRVIVPPAAGFNAKLFKERLAALGRCLHEHGAAIPLPGKPLTSAQVAKVREAAQKCRSVVKGIGPVQPGG